MKSPQDKYRNDVEYRNLVDMMESFIERAQFTPSELREASILASINYETRRVRGFVTNHRVNELLIELEKFTSGSDQ